MTDGVRLAIGFPFWGSQAVPFFLTISAFLLANSLSRVADPLNTWFKGGKVWKSLVRVVIPYLTIAILIFAVEVLLSSSKAFVKYPPIFFLVGGTGPGGYYVPLLIQLYLLFPFFFALFRRRPVLAATIVVLLNIGIELLAMNGLIRTSLFRLCILRYGIVLLGGVLLWRAWSEERLRGGCLIVLGCCLAAGAVYIALITYFGMTPITANNGWSWSAWPVAFYVTPILALALLLEPATCNVASFVENVITKLSEAALHIYLFQMLWFTVLGYCWPISIADGVGLLIQCLLSLLTCIVLGYLFYLFDLQVQKRIQPYAAKLARK